MSKKRSTLRSNRSNVSLPTRGNGGRVSIAKGEGGGGGGRRRGQSAASSEFEEDLRKNNDDDNLFARLYTHHAVKQKVKIQAARSKSVANSVGTMESGAMGSAISLDAFAGHLYDTKEGSSLVSLSRNPR